jgi:hypothetical protein
MSSNSQADAELPTDPKAFYRAGREAGELTPPSMEGLPSALERLGPSPFPKSGFPFLGFLATLYDQIASTTRPASGAKQSAPDNRAEQG